MHNSIDDFLEVRLGEAEDFLKIRETLTRIGVTDREGKTLFQSCHILHKRGRYYIVHFKEMLELDGCKTDFNEEDRSRRNLIASLLADWGLLSVVDESKMSPKATLKQIKIVPYREKSDWTLVPKYHIGKK